jgi:hypothetical protein
MDFNLWMLFMSILSNILTMFLCIVAFATLIRKVQNTRHSPAQNRSHERNETQHHCKKRRKGPVSSPSRDPAGSEQSESHMSSAATAKDGMLPWQDNLSP